MHIVEVDQARIAEFATLNANYMAARLQESPGSIKEIATLPTWRSREIIAVR